MKKSQKFCIVFVLALIFVSCAPNESGLMQSNGRSSTPTQGGEIVLLIPEEPSTLNPYLSETGVNKQVYDSVIEGLVGFDTTGNYYPILVSEIPTLDNGGVSSDFLTVTWRLREGLKWADGEPVTSKDIRFTWEAVSDLSSGALQSGGFDLISSVETPDNLTAVVKYKDFYVGYLSQFILGIFPSHIFGSPEGMSTWEWNRSPISTGPFMLEEWNPGINIVMVTNPNYREENKPYLDRLVFSIIPSYETQLAQMREGEAHAQVWPIESKNEYDSIMGNVAQLVVVPGLWNMELNFNLSKPFDGDPGPVPPHPILGDVRVRRAIAYGINYDYIISEVMSGEVLPSFSPFEYGWYKCEMARPYPTNPALAIELLESAGWLDKDNDGFRECDDCMYADDGTRLELNLLGYSYDPDLQRTEEVLAEQLAELGIKINIQNVDFSIIFGGWSDGAPRKTGDFDLQIYDGLVEAEPQNTVVSQWFSGEIPSADNPEGRNYFRWTNAVADGAILRAGSSPDLAVRRQAYCDLADEMAKDIPVLYLYLLRDSYGFSNRLHGYNVSTWGSLTWDVANWWIDLQN